MTAMALEGRFPAHPQADRNAFLVTVGLIWVGVLSGFGTDSFDHVSKHGLDYPLIVHFHALAFVGWLALFTAQVALVRSDRLAEHKRLGILGVLLAAVMVVIGPATAVIVDANRFAATGRTPEFMAVQFADILAFATLTGAGLLMRRSDASAHKRLMLLGLIYISDAGFARFLNGFVAPMGPGFLQPLTHLYLATWLLVLGFGAYDVVTRRRLHPAYLAGAIWIITIQLTAVTLLNTPAWKALTMRMIGH